MRVCYRKAGKKYNVYILNVEWVEIMEKGVAYNTWTFVEGSSGQVAMAKKERERQ